MKTSNIYYLVSEKKTQIRMNCSLKFITIFFAYVQNSITNHI